MKQIDDCMIEDMDMRIWFEIASMVSLRQEEDETFTFARAGAFKSKSIIIERFQKKESESRPMDASLAITSNNGS